MTYVRVCCLLIFLTTEIDGDEADVAELTVDVALDALKDGVTCKGLGSRLGVLPIAIDQRKRIHRSGASPYEPPL